MADPKLIHGARILMHVGAKLMGVFHNFSYNLAYETGDAYLLGRLSVAEITYLAQEPITGSMAGWRALGHGAHQLGLPELKDLLISPYTTLTAVDRVSGKRVGVVQGVRLTGMGGGFAARQLSDVSIPFKGIMLSDENVTNAEPAGSADLP